MIKKKKMHRQCEECRSLFYQERECGKPLKGVNRRRIMIRLLFANNHPACKVENSLENGYSNFS